MRCFKGFSRVLLIFVLTVPAYAVQGQGTHFWVVPEKPPATDPQPKPVSPPKPEPRQPPKEVPPPPPPLPTPPPKVTLSTSDVIFLLDISGSMEATLGGNPLNKLESAQKALTYFAEAMKQGTRFQLWTFSTHITQHPNSEEHQNQSKRDFEAIGPPDSKARAHLKKLINDLKTDGGTNLYEAIYKAIQYFEFSAYPAETTPRKRYKVIVVLADGQDDELSTITLQHVLSLKRQHPDIEIKTIGFGITPGSPFHQTLCKLASNPAHCALTSEFKELQQMLHSFTRS
ncbi:vWA domain-containing protein [Deltaproteobacteria bacterium TL4]